MRIEIDSERIRRNAEAVVTMCAARGVEVAGVTKSCQGDPDIAAAMVAGGVRVLAESRLDNVRRLRAAGIEAEYMMLRLPARSAVDEVVRLTDVSLNSEVDTVRALSRAARAAGVTHRVLLVIETGDRRDGVLPEDAVAAARAMSGLPGIELAGVATVLGCIGGVLPTPAGMRRIVEVARDIEDALGTRLAVVSGGNTAHLPFLQRGELPARINQLRIGEAIVLGVDSTSFNDLPIPHRDAVRIFAEVLEVKDKPSLPEGPIGIDAFNRVPHWEDRGVRRRAVLELGEMDVRSDCLVPLRPGVTRVGASSDHLVLDVTDAEPPVAVGDELEFDVIYPALSTAMASACATRVIRPMGAAGGAPVAVA
jgi:predicted amino acid racemase